MISNTDTQLALIISLIIWTITTLTELTPRWQLGTLKWLTLPISLWALIMTLHIISTKRRKKQ